MEIKILIGFSQGTSETRPLSLIGMPITFGENKRRWCIKDVTCQGIIDQNNPGAARYFAFVGTKRQLDTECPVKIISFTLDALQGTIFDNEVALYLDREKSITVWMPAPEPPAPLITE
jgi:hypothetical protein